MAEIAAAGCRTVYVSSERKTVRRAVIACEEGLLPLCTVHQTVDNDDGRAAHRAEAGVDIAGGVPRTLYRVDKIVEIPVGPGEERARGVFSQHSCRNRKLK